MTIEIFITIHDQDLVLACEAEGRFAGLDCTYLFVGPRPVDRLPTDVDVIVCRDYADNIEHWPQLYDYTAWWTLARHRLVQAERMICVQYDMRSAAASMGCDVDDALNTHEMVAFTAGHRSAHNWMLLIDGFEDAFRAGLAVGGAAMPPPDFEQWPTTQGTAWRTDAFYEFMHWVRPMLDVWAPNLWAGHLAERSVKAWLSNTGRSEGYVPGAIIHEHLDVHGTCALMGGNTALHQERAATFGR